MSFIETWESSELFVKTIKHITTQKWFVKLKLLIKPDFSKEFLALVDSGDDVNCVQEGSILDKIFASNLIVLCKPKN